MRKFAWLRVAIVSVIYVLCHSTASSWVCSFVVHHRFGTGKCDVWRPDQSLCVALHRHIIPIPACLMQSEKCEMSLDDWGLSARSVRPLARGGTCLLYPLSRMVHGNFVVWSWVDCGFPFRARPASSPSTSFVCVKCLTGPSGGIRLGLVMCLASCY